MAKSSSSSAKSYKSTMKVTINKSDVKPSVKKVDPIKDSCGCTKTVCETAKRVINTNDPKFLEKVRQKATEVWEKSGRIPGRDVQNWLEAERIVKSEWK